MHLTTQQFPEWRGIADAVWYIPVDMYEITDRPIDILEANEQLVWNINFWS